MSVRTPIVPSIVKTRVHTFPQFEFEWHKSIGKVYVVDAPKDGSLTAHGTCIAEHCQTHGQFVGFVQTWLRGYSKGHRDVCGTQGKAKEQ